MRFDKLHEMVPYVTGGKQKILSMVPYTGITLRMPGRHSGQTLPIGGDFVVCVDDETMDWTQHQFTHDDLFKDIQQKTKTDYDVTNNLMGCYYEVINGENPENFQLPGQERLPGIHFKTFLYAVQALAVAEHRRYQQHERLWGGRFLPARFAFGIAEELWTDADAAGKQKYGRPGVQQLERENGIPLLTRKLMGLDQD